MDSTVFWLRCPLWRFSETRWYGTGYRFLSCSQLPSLVKRTGERPRNIKRQLSVRLARLGDGCHSHRSHLHTVLGSTPRRAANFRWESPRGRRAARSSSAIVFPPGKGSYPRNRMIPGAKGTSGVVRPFYHLPTVHGLAPICSATSRWRSPRSIRRFFKWSPSIANGCSVPSGALGLRERLLYSGRSFCALTERESRVGGISTKDPLPRDRPDDPFYG